MRESSERRLLRAAIEIALSEADQPITANEVALHPEVAALEQRAEQISQQLYLMYHSTRGYQQVGRVPYHGKGSSRWAYFDKSKPEKVNDVYSDPAVEDFQFNPVELAEAGEAKAVTLTVGGVTIRIELSC